MINQTRILGLYTNWRVHAGICLTAAFRLQIDYQPDQQLKLGMA